MCRRLLAALCLPVVALLAVACGGGGGTTVAPGPGFHVDSSTPNDGQQNVPVDAVVQVTFSDRLDPASVRLDSIRVGVIEGAGEIPGHAALDDVDPRTIRWTPSATMAPTSPHSCEISAGLRSVDGDLIGGDRTFSFRTGGAITGPRLPTRDDLSVLSGTLNIGRRSHTATRLDDGRVLIAGGFRQGNLITDRGELFAGAGFTLVSSTMVQGRAGHTATLLEDGRVLLTGGWYAPSLGQNATTEWAEVFDPSTGSFQRVGDMTVERVDHAALRLPDGRVLITGGSRLEGTFLWDHFTAEVFDPATNAFTALDALMIHTRATHVMEDMGNGKFALYGGTDVDMRPSWFDTTTETFSPLLPAAQDGARWGAAGATFASGGVCVAGGDSLGTVVYVDPDSGSVHNTGSGLNARRAYGTATRYAADAILVVGGYEFTTGSMSPTSDVVVEGGIAGSRTYGTEMRFSSGMVMHTATVLLNGTVLFCGGLNQTGGEPELDTAYLFTPP